MINKLNYHLLIKPWLHLIIIVTYLVTLQLTNIAYCDLLGSIVDDMEERNSIVNTVTLNSDGTRTITTKDDGEFIISKPTNKLDVAFSTEKVDTGYWQKNERLHQGHVITITKTSPMIEKAHPAPAVEKLQYLEEAERHAEIKIRLEKRKLLQAMAEKTNIMEKLPVSTYSVEDLRFASTIASMANTPSKAAIINGHLFDKIIPELQKTPVTTNPFDTTKEVIKRVLLTDITRTLWLPENSTALLTKDALYQKIMDSNYYVIADPNLPNLHREMSTHVNTIIAAVIDARENKYDFNQVLLDSAKYKQAYDTHIIHSQEYQ